MDAEARRALRSGVVIPAHPLALDANRRLDERRQRALSRYYIAAGSGGLAVGVHTTQFEIRRAGLFEPVLRIAKEECDRSDAAPGREHKLVRIGGAIGRTGQAVREATTLRDLGYHAALLSLAAMEDASDDQLVAHCRAVADVIPLVGFYLQTAVGGRLLAFSFWRKFAEIPNVVAIKMAPFNRYRTIDVVRAVVESGREDIALYTGNDDSIVADLVTPFRFERGDTFVERRIVGGLLGQWSVWNKTAVELLESCHEHACTDQVPAELLRKGVALTDANAAIFDAANGFKGCIAGLHEVLRRQGLLEGVWCLDPEEALGPGQLAEIDRVYAAYPDQNDDAFVARHRDEWLMG